MEPEILLTLLVLAGTAGLFIPGAVRVDVAVLVALALVMAGSFGLDPRGLALLVGICTSNSFLLPTHPVNALLMGPGNYRARDYTAPGSVMTVVFISHRCRHRPSSLLLTPCVLLRRGNRRCRILPARVNL